MSESASESDAPPKKTYARERRSTERSKAGSKSSLGASKTSSPSTSPPATPPASTIPSTTPPSTSSTTPGASSYPTSKRASTAASSSKVSTPRSERGRSKATDKDTATSSPTRDTAVSASRKGDLRTIMTQAEGAKSLFDLRRALFQGDPKETFPESTIKEFDTVIRTRLGGLTNGEGETLASCATRGVEGIKKAFNLQTILDAIAAPFASDERTKLSAGLTKMYTDTAGSKAASKWISEISALRTRPAGRGKERKKEGDTGAADADGGATSGTPSAFKTKSPLKASTAIKNPDAFDTMILDFVKGEMKELLAATKKSAPTSKSTKRQSSKTDEDGTSKAKQRRRSSSSSKSATNAVAESSRSVPPTTTPADSNQGDSSRASRSRSRSRSASPSSRSERSKSGESSQRSSSKREKTPASEST